MVEGGDNEHDDEGDELVVGAASDGVPQGDRSLVTLNIKQVELEVPNLKDFSL